MRPKSVVLLLWGLALVMASCSVRSASKSNPNEEKHPIASGESQERGDWKSENIAGFEVSVASNSVREEIRTIFLLAEPRSFTEQNLKVIFAHLAAEFAEPKALRFFQMLRVDFVSPLACSDQNRQKQLNMTQPNMTVCFTIHNEIVTTLT